MNRLDELTLKLADGELADAEAGELASLLADDPVALANFLRLLEIESGLRSRRREVDLVPAIMARLGAGQIQQLPERVVARIKADAGRNPASLGLPERVGSRSRIFGG